MLIQWCKDTLKGQTFSVITETIPLYWGYEKETFPLCIQDYGCKIKILSLGFVVEKGTFLPAFRSSFSVAPGTMEMEKQNESKL
jgi:hypothetical protein